MNKDENIVIYNNQKKTNIINNEKTDFYMLFTPRLLVIILMDEKM